MSNPTFLAVTVLLWLSAPWGLFGEEIEKIKLVRDQHWLALSRSDWPGEIRINYLEAYCRPNSTDADWVKHTVIAHTSEVVEISEDAHTVRLRDRLADGVVVDHVIQAGSDNVTFELVAHNPTDKESEAHWAQPCVRLSKFLGYDEATAGSTEDYLPQCFIGHEGRLSPLPLREWATKARYTPGQVWRPTHVPESDVNPRPLSPVTPDHGLIGAITRDKKWVYATAWEPYQELFQGVARCLHSDFRIGGLKPGETKNIRGKIYVMKWDEKELMARYKADFPEHF